MAEPKDITELMNSHQDEADLNGQATLTQPAAATGENRYLANPELGLKLCASLIAHQKEANKVSQLFESIQQTIEHDFLSLSKRAGNNASTCVYAQLLSFSDQLKQASNFPELEQHYTVAIGGSFSSGKSRFLNSVMGCPSLLPTDTTPTTSIPTYLYRGDDNTIHALNKFQKKTPIDEEALKAICHAFNQRFQVTFSHLLQLIAVQRKEFAYPNLIFLDTPGYSKSDDIRNSSNNTDENIAREHLRSADYLIWLVDQQNGTVPRQDIEFIRSLQLEQPVLVVISKADKRPEEQVQQIIATARQDLDKADIDYMDVIAYSSQLNREYPVHLSEQSSKRSSEPANVLEGFLKEVNQGKTGSALLWQLEQIASQYLNEFDTRRQLLKLSQKTVALSGFRGAGNRMTYVTMNRRRFLVKQCHETL